MSVPGLLRPTWVDVDLGAVTTNARIFTELLAPSALCAVVKADGYGHGAVEVATAALRGGATWLAVALVDEGLTLRDAGIEVPVLVLSEPPAEAMEQVVTRGLTPTVFTRAGIEALSATCQRLGVTAHPVHLKVDTGMRRIGCDVGQAADLAAFVRAMPGLRLEAMFTHFAVADEPDHPSNQTQVGRFEEALANVASRPPLVHSANTSASIAFPSERRDLSRVGVALYGVSPSEAIVLPVGTKPAMSLKSKVAYAKRLPAGERISYGHHYELERDSYVATVPVGYADGYPRTAFAKGAQVLLGGRRHPVAGAVTMDQLMVDCGDHPVQPGDEVVLLGSQGNESIRAEELGALTDTVGYEIITRIGPRVPRRYQA